MNAGALTETPLTETVCPLASIRIPLPLRSGKLGTPLARMHLENASVGPVGLEVLPAGESEAVVHLVFFRAAAVGANRSTCDDGTERLGTAT